MSFLYQQFVPLMFAGLVGFLLTGLPVAFSLVATGITFGLLGIAIDLFPASLFQALPLRLFGIMRNVTLLSVPFFTLMGLILQRSGMAEDLLETIGQVFGRLRGGLAIAVIIVGALLGATTGVVSAAVISMGLISLPIMLSYGYNRSVATGVITASGTLAQIIPPSLVLIVMADQLGQPVGDLFSGAILPSMILVLLYIAFIVMLAIFKPSWVTALPPEALIYKEENGASGHRSLAILMVLVAIAGTCWYYNHDAAIGAWLGQNYTSAMDERIVASMVMGAIAALILAAGDKLLGLNTLSRLARRVVFVLIPPLMLVFIVLGTIFLGIATPTEGGAMGAVGALVMAWVKKRLNPQQLKQALDQTVQLACFVMLIVIGATVFSFVFIAVDGIEWVKGLFAQLPGGKIGFLLAVNLFIFVLGMFIDYFEIAFIVIPIIAPVAEHMGFDMVWFGIMIAMNLQTSFLTPPFGYALFFLRSVANKNDYTDTVTGARISAITTLQIYKGAFMFIILQVVMIVVMVVYPEMVSRAPALNVAVVELESMDTGTDSQGYNANEEEDLLRGF